MYDVGAWVAGPVIEDKLWFAGTYHDQRLDSYKLGSYNPDGTQVINDNIMWTATAKAAWQMTKTAQLSYFHNLQYKLIGHRGGGTFADSRARNYNDKYPTVNQVKYTSPIGTKMVFDATYSRFRADDAFGSRPEVKPGDIATNDTTTQITEVALPTYSANDMHRDQVRSSMSFFKGAPRREGRLRIRERRAYLARLVDVGAALELRQRRARLGQHVPRAGHATRTRPTAPTSTSCSGSGPTSTASSSRIDGRRFASSR